MENLSKTISEYIEQQFPDVYREDGDNLVAFVKAYFEFLEDTEFSPVKLNRSMFDHRDIDRTLDDFIYHFNDKYLNEFPFVKTVDNRFAVKHIMDYYRSKGTPRAAELLIRFLFNSDSTVYYPGKDVFSLSDSKWFVPRYLEVTQSSRTSSFVNTQITGSVSGAKAFVEGIVRKRIAGRFIDVVYISNLKGNFITDEYITNDSVLGDAPRVIGSLTSITITSGGSGNQVGDIFNVTSSYGLQGKARITELVEETGKITFDLTDGGSGYTLDDNTDAYVADAMIAGDNSAGDFNLYETIQQKRVILDLDSATNINTQYAANNNVGDTLEGVDSGGSHVATGIIYSFANTDAGGNTVTTSSSYSKVEVVVTDGSFLPKYSVDFASANVDFIINETVTEESAITIELGNISGTFSNDDVVAVYVYSDPSEVGGDTVVTNYSKGVILEANDSHLTLIDAWGDFTAGETIGVYEANGTPVATANIVSSTVTSGGAVGTIKTETDSNTWVIELTSGSLDVGNKVRGNTSKVEDTISALTETGVVEVWLNSNSSHDGLKTSVTNTSVSGMLVGQNTSTIGIYANTGSFYYTEDAGFTVQTDRTTTNVSMVITNLYTGEGADFAVASLSDTEYVELNTDDVSDTNVVGQLYTNINVDGSNSGVGYLSSVSSTGGSGYANNQYTLSGGGAANGNPIIDAVVTVTTDGSGEITSIGVDNPGEGYYQEPTLTLSPGSGATITIDMIYGYGFPKNPYGDANTDIEDLLTFANTEIGSIASITTNPGSDYNVNPFVSIYNELVAGYNKQDTRLDITISSGSFSVGENILLDGNVMGEIKTANSTVIFLKRTIFEPVWSSNTTIVGQTTGAVATIDIRANDAASSPMGDNAVIESSVTTDAGTAGVVEIVNSGYGYLNDSSVTLTKTGSNDITGTALLGRQGVGTGYWTTTKSHISDTSKIHDNKYYQEYSYEIQSNVSLNKYRDIARNVLHVAGTELFGAVIKNTKIDMNQTSIGSTVEAQDDFADAFIMTVTTTTAFQTFTIPTQDVGTFDAIIDWGDGKARSIITSYNDADLTHTYAAAGDHQIRITGTFPNIWFNNAGDKLMVKSVENFGKVGWTRADEAFYGCSNMTSFTSGTTDTSALLYMNNMFRGCTSLTTLDVSGFDTSSVTNMYSVFYNCSSLTTLDVSSFDTSSVTDMYAMFFGCSGLTTLDISSFDTSSVTNMYSMFRSCSGLTTLDVSGFNTALVTTMYAMFYGCSGLTTLDVSSFDTSSVTNMYAMFRNCSGLTTLDLSGFNTALVTNMWDMFYNCSGLTGITGIDTFDTSSVTTMRYMFLGCSGLTTLDVSGFNTALVTTMYGMFYNCSGLTTLDVSSFDTSSVTTMSYMFYNCSGVTDIIGVDAFDISGLNTSISLNAFATNVTLPTSRYNALLIAWEAQDPLNGMAPNFGGSKYTGGGAAAAARLNLTTVPVNWTITDGGIA